MMMGAVATQIGILATVKGLAEKAFNTVVATNKIISEPKVTQETDGTILVAFGNARGNAQTAYALADELKIAGLAKGEATASFEFGSKNARRDALTKLNQNTPDQVYENVIIGVSNLQASEPRERAMANSLAESTPQNDRNGIIYLVLKK